MNDGTTPTGGYCATCLHGDKECTCGDYLMPKTCDLKPVEKATSEILLCDCHSSEHQVLIKYWDDEDIVYVSIHLHSSSFWSRLKYLFGYKSRFGAWDEVLIPKEEFTEMVERMNPK